MDSYELEKITKGFSNYRRIDVIMLLSTRTDLSVDEIANSCNVDYKTIAEHLRKLSIGGIVSKKRYGRRVEHNLTKRGRKVLDFLKTIE